MPIQRTKRRDHGTGSFRNKNGSEYFVFRPVPGRPQKWVKIGKSGELGRKVKEKKAREILASYVPPDEREAVTYKRAGDLLIKKLESLDRSPATIEAYESTMRCHFEDWHERDVRTITRKDVERKQLALRRVGAPKSVNNWIGNAKAIFNFCVKEGWIDRSPGEHVENIKIKKQEGILFLTAADLRKLLAAVPDDELGQMEKVMYEVDFETGQRMGEIRAVRWEDLDYFAERVNIERSNNGRRGEIDGPTKGGKPRSVPMTRRSRDLLEGWFRNSKYRAPSDRIFCHPETGKAYDRSKLRKRFKAACLKAGIGPFKDIKRKDGHLETVTRQTFHSLRRSYGTTLAKGGAKAIEIKENMGHTRIEQTEKYMGFAPDSGEAERFGAMFEAERIAALAD
jgi:integrase